MALCTFPVIGKAVVLHDLLSLPSAPLKNGLRIAPIPRVASQFCKLTMNNTAWGLLKCKAMAQNGQPNRNSAVLATSTRTEIVLSPRSASEVVREFYSRINSREPELVGELIAENCVYDDLVFPQPFVGRKAIIEFFKKFTDATSTDLQFVIDDITSQDSSAVGITWHLDWRGKPFPFSRGCSFYRCEIFNGKQQIIYGRDSVEPATKPGDMALVAIKAVTSLLDRFPQLADRKVEQLNQRQIEDNLQTRMYESAEGKETDSSSKTQTTATCSDCHLENTISLHENAFKRAREKLDTESNRNFPSVINASRQSCQIVFLYYLLS